MLVCLLWAASPLGLVSSQCIECATGSEAMTQDWSHCRTEDPCQPKTPHVRTHQTLALRRSTGAKILQVGRQISVFLGTYSVVNVLARLPGRPKPGREEQHWRALLHKWSGRKWHDGWDVLDVSVLMVCDAHASFLSLSLYSSIPLFLTPYVLIQLVPAWPVAAADR